MGQEATRPLTESDIVRLLEGGVTSARVATLVSERGVGFDPSAEVEHRLRQAGADDALVAAVTRAAAPPEEAIRRLRLADLRARDGDRTGALNELAECARLAPQWAELRYQSGLIYEILRQYPEAIAAWGKYLEMRPETARKPEMVAKVAEWEYRRDKRKKAEGLAAQAQEMQEKGDAAAALDLARQGVEADPESAWARAELADQLISRRSFDDGLTEAREAVRLDAQLGEGHRQLARALREKGDNEAAEREARAATRLAPEDNWAHATLAVVLARAGKSQDAVAEARESVRLAPQRWEGPVQVARELSYRKEVAPALALLREYLAANPDRIEVRLNLVSILVEQDDLKAAEPEARESVRRAPQNAATHDQLAWVLVRQERWDAALAEVEEAIRLDPNAPGFRLRQGWILRKQGKMGRAAVSYREILERDPKFVPAYVELAWTLYAMEDYLGALPHAQMAVKLAPDTGTHTLLGTILSSAGQLDEAYNQLQEALRLDRNNPTAHNNLGVVYEKRGDYASAAAEFREAQRLDPNEPLYRNNLDRLEKRPPQ